MFSIALCLSNKDYMNEIEILLKNMDAAEYSTIKIFKYYSAEELLIAMEEKSILFHLVFLDLLYPSKVGFQTAGNIQKLCPDTEFIFLSDTYDFLTESFKFNLKNYFKIPLDFSAFRHAMQSYFSKKLEHTFLEIKNKNLYKKIMLNKIISIESYGRTVTITTTENETVITYYTMEQLEKYLPNDKFIRCHKSYIVNVNYISTLSGSTITTIDNKIIPIGRIYKNRVMQVFCF